MKIVGVKIAHVTFEALENLIGWSEVKKGKKKKQGSRKNSLKYEHFGN